MPRDRQAGGGDRLLDRDRVRIAGAEGRAEVVQAAHALAAAIPRDEDASGHRQVADIAAQLCCAAVLGEHHPDINIGQAVGLVSGSAASAIGVAMGELFKTAFPRAVPDDRKDKPARPRKPRGASKPSSSPGAAQT